MKTHSKTTYLWRGALGAVLSGGSLLAFHHATTPAEAEAKPVKSAKSKSKGVGRVVKSEAQWKKILTPMQFNVLRKEGTEAPGSGDHHPVKTSGFFHCAGCNLALFASNKMFDSGTGWPSFWQPIAGRVIETTDADGERVEVSCARCDGHLGHVFKDGPKPTGLRYCMNSVAMKFAKK